MRYFFIFLSLLVFSTAIADDYSFTITGELPVKSMRAPEILLRVNPDIPFEAEKKNFVITFQRKIPTLPFKTRETQNEIRYSPEKRLIPVQTLPSVPERLIKERPFFSDRELLVNYKSRKFEISKGRTSGIGVQLLKRKPLLTKDIFFDSKNRYYNIPDVPKRAVLKLAEEKEYVLKEDFDFLPMKKEMDKRTRILIGTVDLKEYRLGLSNQMMDILVSNGENHLYLKSDDVFIGARGSVNEISAMAFFPGFEFNTRLFDDTFVLRTIRDMEDLDSFNFGLLIINTTPLPVINWYTKDFSEMFSIGLDLFSTSSYGLGVRLKNDPVIVKGSTGYDFASGLFHSLIDARYVFENGLLDANVSYSDKFGFGLGAQYNIIEGRTFNMKIYGNIGYNDDWLISAGSGVRWGNVDFKASLNYASGGISVNVEAGYSF